MFKREIPLRVFSSRPSSSAYSPLQPDDKGVSSEPGVGMSPRAGPSKLFASKNSKRKGKYLGEPEDEVDLLRESSEDEHEYDRQQAGTNEGNAISMEEGHVCVSSLPFQPT